MNTKALLSLNAMIAIVAVASIAMISGVSEAPMVIADDEKAKGLYKMADGIQIVGTFDFRDGTEIVNIPDYSQTNEFTSTAGPSFEFVKAVTNTPILHKAADVFQIYQTRDSGYDHHYNNFEAIIDVYQEGKHIRSFQYTDCQIDQYKVDTLSDKEEAYNGKGFAVVEEYDVSCMGYKPYAMDFEQMMDDMTHKGSNQLSSLDLLEQKSVWEQHLNPTDVEDVKSSNKMNSLEMLQEQASWNEYRNIRR